ncbi:NADH-ubiquinone oxidoreductase-F iron-sulfur binding region domain-containing protein [Solirubrobacter soli]|uniref:NADH-ubiquinone oxidoreductase-F iron-sulfur binding region domain-containing protein n=1 Tax=Solirubrobacter soli TaxID=363832 RepID=UPI00040BBB9F|nr:NADH-ubiquinone oxidoreductase-F iron-sulfur binding region domain-containing protein [Solirubrobacter soli]
MNPRLLSGHAGGLDVAYRGAGLIDAVAAAGLRGRGGAAFPTAVKLRAVAQARGRCAVVANATEGEPMSAKDQQLLVVAPQLVLDGAALAAEAVGARDIVIAVKRSAWAAQESLTRALAARGDRSRMRMAVVGDAYLAGEETALLRGLNGGPTKPTGTPPRPHERGLARRPTLVSNVETLAHVALIARHGAAWFRELGTPEHPGTALVTVSGAVARPAVYEAALGTPVEHVIAAAGGASSPLRAVLFGGYHGTWLSTGAPARLDATLGPGVIVALGADACPVAELSRVVRWMADANARQCGPCMYGLEAIAGAIESLQTGIAARDVFAQLERWGDHVTGRGACRHPDGVVRFVRSGLDVFAGEFEDHRRFGRCDACDAEPVLAVPNLGRELAA